MKVHREIIMEVRWAPVVRIRVISKGLRFLEIVFWSHVRVEGRRDCVVCGRAEVFELIDRRKVLSLRQNELEGIERQNNEAPRKWVD